MTEVLLRRTIGGLALDEKSAVMDRIPIGTIIIADIKDPRRRSTAYHRFFFALLNKCFENQSYFSSVDQLRHALLARLGYVDVIKLRDRDVVVPRSMKFDKMSRDAFEKFTSEAIAFLVSEVIPGMDANALRSEIERMIEPRQAAE